jgi:hypothetical protein
LSVHIRFFLGGGGGFNVCFVLYLTLLL